MFVDETYPVSRGQRGDQGSLHVLEAITMTTVMLTSLAFVVTYDQPRGGAGAPRAALEHRVQDVLGILNDTPLSGSALGNNELSVGLLECLQNNCSRIASSLQALLPTGTSYALYLSTGAGRYPVYVPNEPTGEAVTSSRLIEPAWSYQFMATSQSMYNPLEDPMVVYAIPIYSANAVEQGGSALSIVAIGNHTSDHSAYILKTAASTRSVGPNDQPSAAGISVYFHDGDGVAIATKDVHAQTESAGIATNAPVGFHARVEESAGGVVPAGTILTVEMPHGWTARASSNANPDWQILANATDNNGSAAASDVVAKLLHAVSSGAVDLAFNATYTGDADDYYTFDAILSGGAYARGALLVRGDAHGTTPAYEVPTLTASVPRPLGNAATTTWTLAAISSDPVEVTHIDIKEEEGRPIFADVQGISGPGTWTRTADTLSWDGDVTLGQDAPLGLTFHVTSTSLSGPAAERAPFIPSVTFGNFSAGLPDEPSPGLHAGVFLPATATRGGYDSTLLATRPIDSTSIYRATALPGEVNYSVGPALGLRDSLFGSAITLDHRSVTPGSTLQLSLELQSLVYQLAALDLEPTIELNVYPPWAGNDRTPFLHEEVYNGTLAKGAGTFRSLVDLNGDGILDPTHVGRVNVSLGIPQHALYGAYVVEANVTWLETLTLPGPISQDVVRTARVYDHFVVKPPNGDLPSSPVYDVELLAWYQDWG